MSGAVVSAEFTGVERAREQLAKAEELVRSAESLTQMRRTEAVQCHAVIGNALRAVRVRHNIPLAKIQQQMGIGQSGMPTVVLLVECEDGISVRADIANRLEEALRAIIAKQSEVTQ